MSAMCPHRNELLCAYCALVHSMTTYVRQSSNLSGTHVSHHFINHYRHWNFVRNPVSFGRLHTHTTKQRYLVKTHHVKNASADAFHPCGPSQPKSMASISLPAQSNPSKNSGKESSRAESDVLEISQSGFAPADNHTKTCSVPSRPVRRDRSPGTKIKNLIHLPNPG